MNPSFDTIAQNSSTTLSPILSNDSSTLATLKPSNSPTVPTTISNYTSPITVVRKSNTFISSVFRSLILKNNNSLPEEDPNQHTSRPKEKSTSICKEISTSDDSFVKHFNSDEMSDVKGHNTSNESNENKPSGTVVPYDTELKSIDTETYPHNKNRMACTYEPTVGMKNEEEDLVPFISHIKTDVELNQEHIRSHSFDNTNTTQESYSTDQSSDTEPMKSVCSSPRQVSKRIVPVHTPTHHDGTSSSSGWAVRWNKPSTDNSTLNYTKYL